MADVYRDAYVTISALSAFRANHGFLPDERVPDVLPFYCEGSPTSPGRMLLEYHIPRPFRKLGKYESVVIHVPLDPCAWCLQESALTPRRLIFQPPDVYYKCRSLTALEISRKPPFQSHLQIKTSPSTDDHILFRTQASEESSAALADEDALRTLWRRVVVDYSSRGITNSADKLVAIASIVLAHSRSN